jgi:hypothetical protein
MSGVACSEIISMDELLRELILSWPMFSYSMDGRLCFNINDPKRTVYRKLLTKEGEVWEPAPPHSALSVDQEQQ